ncbi:MAG TPA: hypothetical protein PLT92_13590 [Ignavibacteriaceae bacterium]|nr:hypothetical protein [Ignavibacteriaceae bacterium]
MALFCTNCGGAIDYNYSSSSEKILCKDCAFLLDRVDEEVFNNSYNRADNGDHGETKLLITVLQVLGIISLTAGAILGIIVLLNAKTDLYFVVLGIYIIFQGFVFMLVFISLAKILKQNNYLINETKNKTL